MGRKYREDVGIDKKKRGEVGSREGRKKVSHEGIIVPFSLSRALFQWQDHPLTSNLTINSFKMELLEFFFTRQYTSRSEVSLRLAQSVLI